MFGIEGIIDAKIHGGGAGGSGGGSSYNSVFANNDWSDIISACQGRAVPYTWVVGDQKPMIINGKSYLIDIIGKEHDVYSSDGSSVPLTLQMHDCYETSYGMNQTGTNVGGWESCKIRVTTLPSILELMPLNVKSAIKNVNKFTSAGSQSNTIVTTADKLFLLSEAEILGSAYYDEGGTYYSSAGEGFQYKYYADGNSNKKARDGVLISYWERSPECDYATSFCYIHRLNTSGSVSAETVLGVSFAFCF